MSTAAQLLRSIADLVDAGAALPTISKLRSGALELRFFTGTPVGTERPYVDFFDAPLSRVMFVPRDSEPFTARDWRTSVDGQPVVIAAYQDGDTRTDAEILLEAAEHIRAHGLAQDGYNDETGACCVSGAIQYVTSGYADDYKCGQSAKRVFAEALGLFAAADADSVTVESLIGRWNDEDGRTADQVVLALLQVADQERAAEQHAVVTA